MGLHSVTLGSIILGLFAVIKSNTDKAFNIDDGYSANLYSLHSFLGMAAILIYLSNYFGGLTSFLIKCWSEEQRRNYLPSHMFLGVMTLLVSLCAIHSGLMEVQSVNADCQWVITQPVDDPSSKYSAQGMGCKLLNGIGIVALVSVFLTAYVILPPLVVVIKAPLPNSQL